MGLFNEWLTKTHGDLPELTTSPDLGMTTRTDEAMILNQLDQLVDRVTGLLHTVNEDKRDQLIKLFISNLQARV